MSHILRLPGAFKSILNFLKNSCETSLTFLHTISHVNVIWEYALPIQCQFYYICENWHRHRKNTDSKFKSLSKNEMFRKLQIYTEYVCGLIGGGATTCDRIVSTRINFILFYIILILLCNLVCNSPDKLLSSWRLQ